MEIQFKIYTAVWSALCFCAVYFMLSQRHSFLFLTKQYQQFLFIKWKIITFLIATVGLTIVAPYSGDPTWTYFDSILMAVLTFFTAPWAVGTFYLAARRKASWRQLFVAFCLMLFSASWCYDLYLVIRDGSYPVTWLANMAASSVLYISAGMFWNLDYRPGRGPTFSFQEENWMLSNAGGFNRILWYALPFMIIGGGSIAYLIY